MPPGIRVCVTSSTPSDDNASTVFPEDLWKISRLRRRPAPSLFTMLPNGWDAPTVPCAVTFSRAGSRPAGRVGGHGPSIRPTLTGFALGGSHGRAAVVVPMLAILRNYRECQGRISSCISSSAQCRSVAGAGCTAPHPLTRCRDRWQRIGLGVALEKNKQRGVRSFVLAAWIGPRFPHPGIDLSFERRVF